MKLEELERDESGWIYLPCNSLIVDADEHVLTEHVPYCATCAGQIDHASSDSEADARRIADGRALGFIQPDDPELNS